MNKATKRKTLWLLGQLAAVIIGITSGIMYNFVIGAIAMFGIAVLVDIRDEVSKPYD